MHVLHFEEQRTLVTGVELHLDQGLKDPRAQGLGTERGHGLGAVVSPQHAEDIRTPCLRLHPDGLQVLGHPGSRLDRGVAVCQATRLSQEVEQRQARRGLTIGDATPGQEGERLVTHLVAEFIEEAGFAEGRRIIPDG